MLDQLLNIVKQYSRDAVINNPEVPNEQNNEVMAEATKTIASGFQNVMAGGGLQNILDLFKGNSGAKSGTSQQSGIGGLLRNPIVTMMIGYFISKLVSKYKMSPAAASNVANSVIPNSLNGLIQKTRDPNENQFTLDNLVNSLTGGGNDTDSPGGAGLQEILERFTGGGNGNGNGSGLQDIISRVTQRAQQDMENREQAGGSGIMDMLKGLLSR
ncbi:MAG TPA: hypothetical protein VFX58_08120 [Chitinophagaceae bacterium]|nr:hypothetical protein [Chitinophagaceae bacterium]